MNGCISNSLRIAIEFEFNLNVFNLKGVKKCMSRLYTKYNDGKLIS